MGHKPIDIDLLVTGSSRPQLVPYTVKSFMDKVHYSGRINIIWHEDFVIPEESRKVIKWLRDCPYDVQILESPKPKELGWAIDYSLQYVTAKYMFYLQDDWEFERHVDLDRLIWTMDKHSGKDGQHGVNLIFLPKQRNPMQVNGFELVERELDGLRLCLYNIWAQLPGVWRMSFIRERWSMREYARRHVRAKASYPPSEGYFTERLGTGPLRMQAEYVQRFMGTYVLGGLGEYRYVRHLGNTWRMEPWKLDPDGSPGGQSNCEPWDLRSRAPWLPTIERRPMRKPIDDPKAIEMLKKQFPDSVKSFWIKDQ